MSKKRQEDVKQNCQTREEKMDSVILERTELWDEMRKCSRDHIASSLVDSRVAVSGLQLQILALVTHRKILLE